VVGRVGWWWGVLVVCICHGQMQASDEVSVYERVTRGGGRTASYL
jgi:hypothetical protein